MKCSVSSAKTFQMLLGDCLVPLKKNSSKVYCNNLPSSQQMVPKSWRSLSNSFYENYLFLQTLISLSDFNKPAHKTVIPIQKASLEYQTYPYQVQFKLLKFQKSLTASEWQKMLSPDQYLYQIYQSLSYAIPEGMMDNQYQLQ